jgi:hypothetical protein
MDRESLLALWDESWTEGTWFGSWSKSLAGLTPAQAAWHPQPGAHSIWQLVAHVIFWREITLDTLAGKPRPTADEIARRNFPEPAHVTDEAWDAARAALEASHRGIREAIAHGSEPHRLRYHLVHDANHLGQILYVRALMGLPPVEA